MGDKLPRLLKRIIQELPRRMRRTFGRVDVVTSYGHAAPGEYFDYDSMVQDDRDVRPVYIHMSLDKVPDSIRSPLYEPETSKPANIVSACLQYHPPYVALADTLTRSDTGYIMVFITRGTPHPSRYPNAFYYTHSRVKEFILRPQMFYKDQLEELYMCVESVLRLEVI